MLPQTGASSHLPEHRLHTHSRSAVEQLLKDIRQNIYIRLKAGWMWQAWFDVDVDVCMKTSS